MTLNDLIKSLPRHGWATARILVGMEQGEQGAAFQDAIKAFNHNELTSLGTTMMNKIDPYKAPEQNHPVAAMIARYIIDERTNSKGLKK